MKLRVLRLAAVAAILALALTARAVTTAYADAGDAPAEAAPAPAPAPPAEPSAPPSDPPPADRPLPSDPPPADPPPADLPPVAGESPPADPLGGVLTDIPPADAPGGLEPAPDPLDPLPATDPSVPIPVTEPVPEPPPSIDDPSLAEPPVAELVPPAPENPVQAATTSISALPAPEPRAVAVIAPAQTAAPAPAPAAVDTAAEPAAVSLSRTAATLKLIEPGWVPYGSGLVALHKLEPLSAGLVAGLAVTNRAPASVAVAIEFGRAGGGWASAVVFNLWLRRQLRERRMSQRQLAALSGVDHSTISRLLMRDRRPSLATATKLAKALRHVEGESDTADYFERSPAETLFPGRRVELALRADELLDEESVLGLMRIYLDTRRKRQAQQPPARTRAGPEAG